MPRFFVDDINGDKAVITGEDASHIIRSLRMKQGDKLTVCDGMGTDYFCRIESISQELVVLYVEHSKKSVCEPDIELTVYQGLPKSDKMDTIVQKSVELGAYRIVPVLTERSVSRPDGKSSVKKRERWERIAFEAAKQCGRGIIPKVENICDFKTALKMACEESAVIFLYEGGGKSLRDIMPAIAQKKISFFIGPEGGFSDNETELAKELSAHFATLGPRILRTETAPLAAITAVMLLSGNMDSGGNDNE